MQTSRRRCKRHFPYSRGGSGVAHARSPRVAFTLVELLRGTRVTIRAIEPDTRQVRQVSVISDFLPE